MFFVLFLSFIFDLRLCISMSAYALTVLDFADTTYSYPINVFDCTITTTTTTTYDFVMTL